MGLPCHRTNNSELGLLVIEALRCRCVPGGIDQITQTESIDPTRVGYIVIHQAFDFEELERLHFTCFLVVHTTNRTAGCYKSLAKNGGPVFFSTFVCQEPNP